MTTGFPEAAPWGEQRASHADRETVVRRLQQAAVEGRIDFHELDERLERALDAKTHGELAVLTADLQGAGRGGAAGAVRELVEDHPLVLKGGLHGVVRKGPWTVPSRVTAHGGLAGVVVRHPKGKERRRLERESKALTSR